MMALISSTSALHTTTNSRIFFFACQQRNERIERNELITENAIEKMSNEVTEAFALKYPIMYETYNICEIVGQSRLAKFSTRTLQNLCSALELDVASMTGKRKQPYMEIIEGVAPGVALKLVRD